MKPLPTEPLPATPLRVIFMGSPDLALPCVQRLHDGPEDLIAVFSQPDKRVGRGRKTAPPPVARWATEHGVPLYQPASLKRPRALDTIDPLEPDLVVVVAYGKILPPLFLRRPRYGCLNVHLSLLPAYRGAGPIQWAVLDGRQTTGVTTMLMDDGLDTGPILLQREDAIRPEDTAGSLADRLAELGADLLEQTLRELRAGTLAATPQPEQGASYAPQLTKQLGQIDWTRSAEEIERLVRGTHPWPGAYTFRQGKRVKILRCYLVDNPATDPRPGELVAADRTGITVACGSGFLSLADVQPEGKRPMDICAFCNGSRVQQGEVWGDRT